MSYMINGRLVVKPPEGFVNVLNTGPHRGMAYAYIVNAVTKLGRPLKPSEVVHHIDGDQTNDSPDNLMVFRTNSDHVKYHRNGFREDILVDNLDGTFSVKTCFCGSDLDYVCDYCGVAFRDKKYNHRHGSNIFCSQDCCRKYRRRDIPNRDTLINLLSQYNLNEISKLYGVSYNAAKKWCIGYGVDYKNLR